jgi:dihydropteroate synthase
VLNVTPDSFSDGGEFLLPDQAVAHARRMISEGAAVIDIGGESTRPGATRVNPEEEARRVIPVVTILVEEGIRCSIDTMNSSTALAAIKAGVRVVNDVSGGLADPQMLGVVADSDVDYVMMHWRGHAETMDGLATYEDVLGEVRSELEGRLEAAHHAGIEAKRIILDPGLGFAKTPAHNWALLAGISELQSLGHRLLVGASRKRFLGELLPEGHALHERDVPSATLGVVLGERGVWGLRVHNPAIHAQALDVWQAVAEGGIQ